jgi:hypothetical protein
MMDHPVSDALLAHAVAGTASRAELRTVVAHLLRGCPDCAGRLRALLAPPQPEAAYDRALGRFEAGLRAALEMPAGPVSVLWAVIEGRQPGGRGTGRGLGLPGG